MQVPSAPVILNVVLLITLLLAFGLSSTAFGFFAHNNRVSTCPLNYSTRSFTYNSKNKLCSTSSAGYIIATICIAVVTLLEFKKLVHGLSVNIVGRIIQIALLAVSGVLLLIGGISVAVGWSQTCKNIVIEDYHRYKKLHGPITCNSASNIIGFNYQEMVGSAVCAFLSMIFVIIATVVTIVNTILSRNTLEKK